MIALIIQSNIRYVCSVFSLRIYIFSLNISQSYYLLVLTTVCLMLSTELIDEFRMPLRIKTCWIIDGVYSCHLQN